MSVPAAIGLLAALVAATSLLALIIRRTSGRGRVVNPGRPTPEIPLGDRRLGRTATFVQFGTETCAPCHVASRRIGAFAAEHDGVVHVELDTADHPDLARSLNILSAPTTFLLDSAGRIRVRFVGVPRPGELDRHVASLLPAGEPSPATRPGEPSPATGAPSSGRMGSGTSMSGAGLSTSGPTGAGSSADRAGATAPGPSAALEGVERVH